MVGSTDKQGRPALRIMFVATAMGVGGQEVLLMDILRSLDRARFAPELCCLKAFGRMGKSLPAGVPAYERILVCKADVRVVWRLARLMRRRRIDVAVTVGTGGDRMFWGRLAAWTAHVPVILSALDSSGTNRVELLNRLLGPVTDAFIAIGDAHAQYVVDYDHCPARKVRVIPNGVDATRFCSPLDNAAIRKELGIPSEALVAGIVARLRPEKNHARFIRVAAAVRRQIPEAHFLVVGHGPARRGLEALADHLGVGDCVHFCGMRSDIPEVLAAMDLFVLTSDLETSPVSILEAMAAGKAVVSTAVGSVPELVTEGVTGYLVEPDNEGDLAACVAGLLSAPARAAEMGRVGREKVLRTYSIDRMVRGYEQLIEEIHARKRAGLPRGRS